MAKKAKVKLEKPEKLRTEKQINSRNMMMKAARIVLWTVIAFFFFRGVSLVFQKDDSEEVKEIISDFEAEFSAYQYMDSEVSAFAQNFLREYLTYAARGEADHKIRIQAYISSNIRTLNTLIDYKQTATATYVAAYRKEETAPNHYDVYVQALVNYIIVDPETKEEKTVFDSCTCRVPVFAKNGAYVVEALPQFVSDQNTLTDYQVIAYTGDSVTEETTKEIQTSVSNFLKAYYSDSQNAIDYYLHASANKEEFAGLGGRYTFGEIKSVKCTYQNKEYIAAIIYTIQDSVNLSIIQQQVTCTLVQDNSKYLLKTMTTRINDIQ